MDYNQSIVNHLAYNGCTKIRDEATGKLFNYTGKNHLIKSYVSSPPGCSWSADRADFSNAVMSHCRKKHPRSRLGRAIVAACPDGLSQEKFINQSITYANFIGSYFNTTVYVDLHDPKKSDPEAGEKSRNLHAHFFFPSYTVTPEGFGAKKKLRDLDLKTRSSKMIEELREQWARTMEQGFVFQGDEVKLEHRSYKRQGLTAEAQPKIGSAARAKDLRGEKTDRMQLIEAVRNRNEQLTKIEVEEEALKAEIERLESLQNLSLPESLVGTHTIDDHVNQRSYKGTHVYAQRTYEWLAKHYGDEPMLSDLFEDFELLLDGPRAEEEKIPELPPEPSIGDLFESLAMWIDRLELRKRPRPHHVRKSARPSSRSRSSPLMEVALDR